MCIRWHRRRMSCELHSSEWRGASQGYWGRLGAQALYEMPDDDITPENVSKLADETERRIQGALAGRPLLAVPHVSL